MSTFVVMFEAWSLPSALAGVTVAGAEVAALPHRSGGAARTSHLAVWIQIRKRCLPLLHRRDAVALSTREPDGPSPSFF
jgi:hypothetical protein